MATEPKFNGKPPVSDFNSAYIVCQQALEQGFRTIEFNDLVLKAGANVNGAIKITGLSLPTLGVENKTAEVSGGANGKTFTWSGGTLNVRSNYGARFFWDGELKIWSKDDEWEYSKGLDGRDISDWTAKVYTYASGKGSLIFHLGGLYENKANTLATDVPGVSTKWKQIASDNNYLVTNGIPTFSRTNKNIIATVPNIVMNYYATDGTLIAALAVGSDQLSKDYAVNDGSMLIWNLDSNTLVVVANNSTTRNSRNVILAVNRDGIICQGYYKEWYNQWFNRNLVVDGRFVITAGTPTFSRALNTITVVLPTGGYIFYRDKIGGTAFTMPDEYKGIVHTIGATNMLVWNLDNNTVSVVSSTQPRYSNDVILLANSNIGVVFKGELQPYYNRWCDKIDLINYEFNITGNQRPIIDKVSNVLIKITLPNVDIRVVNNQSGVVTILPEVYKNIVFEVGADSRLYWDLEANTVGVYSGNLNVNIAYKKGILLAGHRGGRITAGALEGFYLQYETEQKTYFKDAKMPITEQRFAVKKTFSGGCQGMTVVAGELWQATAASDTDTSVYATMRRWNTSDYSDKAGTVTHNLGHAASMDYNLETDVLLVGNGSTGANNYQRIDLVLNASQYNGDTSKVIDRTNPALVTSIHFRTAIKDIGGKGSVVCFSENKQIVYLMITNGIAKVALGMGTNDFSDKTVGQDSMTAWGTFIVGKGANEYNGTAKVLATYVGANHETMQGICYRDGYIYLSLGYAVAQAHIAKIKVYTDGYYRFEGYITLPEFITDGTYVHYEPQGICFLNDSIITTIYNTNGNRVVSIPYYGKQGGSGVTGVKVLYDFKCYINPNIQITPTNNVTDLFISSRDKDGFTVASSLGGSGEFNWTCTA